MKRELKKLKIIFAMFLIFLVSYCITRNIEFETEEIKLIFYRLDEIVKLEVRNETGSYSFELLDEIIQDPEDGLFPVDQAEVYAVIDLIKELEYTRKFEEPDELAVYGLDDPSSTITINEEITVLFGNETDSGESYCKIEDENEVYTISSTLVTKIDDAREDYIELNEISGISEATLEKIEFIVDETNYTIEAAIDEESEVTWTLKFEQQEKALDSSMMENLFEALEELEITGWIDYFADDVTLNEYGISKEKSLVIQDGAETYELWIGNEIDEDDTAVVFANTRLIELASTEVIKQIEESVKELAK